MSVNAALALARTVQLISDDVFGRRLGEDPALDRAIIAGLRSTIVRVVSNRENLESYAGQTVLVTLFGQLAMMGLSVDLDIPQIDVLEPQPPLPGSELRAALLSYGTDLIPEAQVGSGLGKPDLTLVIGNSPYEGPEALRITGDAWRCRVEWEGRAAPRRWEGAWPFGALAGAGAASAEGLRAALPRVALLANQPLPPNPWFRLDRDRRIQLDLSVPGLERPQSLGEVDFVSGGAITFSALYCLARVPRLSGQVRVIEPERFDMPNLNRYGLARRSDCGRLKIDILQEISYGGLSVVGEEARFDGGLLDRIGPLSERVLVGVDDIPSRWAVQRAVGGWLCVAGTSHIYGLVTTHRPGQPCAGCAHPRDDDFDGPIPTISFVSFWAGLIQARALLAEVAGAGSSAAAMHVWPFGLYGPRALQAGGVAPRADCPVGCRASRAVA